MGTDRAIILNGFKEDCEKLISRFEQASDIRFETFCEIWQNMKFSLVFTGRQTILELLEFCEGALHIAKQFLLQPPRFKEKIGGLYLLYGVYYKMPIDQFKIRIKLEDWKHIMELHAEIKEGEHLDANYILCKLVADNAFHYCIFDREFGLERHFRVRERQCFNPYSILPAMKDLVEDHEVLTSINELSKAYEKKKAALIEKGKSSTSLNLYNTDFAEEIARDVRAFEEQRKNKHSKNNVQDKKTNHPSTSREGLRRKPQMKSNKKKMSSKLGDGFEVESDESEEEETVGVINFDPDLPETFE